MTINKTLLGLAVAASVLGLAVPALAADTKIGIVLGFTGPLENLSPPMAASAQLAIKNVNDGGGLAGTRQLRGDDALQRCVAQLLRGRLRLRYAGVGEMYLPARVIIAQPEPVVTGLPVTQYVKPHVEFSCECETAFWNPRPGRSTVAQGHTP